MGSRNSAPTGSVTASASPRAATSAGSDTGRASRNSFSGEPARTASLLAAFAARLPSASAPATSASAATWPVAIGGVGDDREGLGEQADVGERHHQADRGHQQGGAPAPARGDPVAERAQAKANQDARERQDADGGLRLGHGRPSVTRRKSSSSVVPGALA